MVNDLDARLPAGATLMASDIELQDEYFVLSDRRAPGWILLTLWDRARRGELSAHLIEFGEQVKCSPLYVISRGSFAPEIGTAADSVLGPAGFKCGSGFELKPISRYVIGLDSDDVILLYSVEPRISR
ncbi:MAG: hypothetical protein JO189_26530 [Deltaproteobacteria bacterium]|nr:hypothetical protein [Deltaproteobacteria bacterium]